MTSNKKTITEKEPSNMENIIKTLYNVDEIKGKPAKERWIDTKRGWQNYQNNSKDIINILNIIKNNITSKPNWKYPEPVHKKKRMIIDSEVAQKLGGKGEQNREVYVERYIANSDLKMCNQWCVGKNNKESIDLIYKNDNSCTLIELKVSGLNDNGTYTPPFALVEIIKNYYLAQEFIKNKKKNININELAILSTKDFFKKFSNNVGSIKKFLEDKKKFEDNIGIPINLYYLDIDEKDLVEDVKEYSYKQDADNYNFVDAVKNWNKKKIDAPNKWPST